MTIYSILLYIIFLMHSVAMHMVFTDTCKVVKEKRFFLLLIKSPTHKHCIKLYTGL